MSFNGQKNRSKIQRHNRAPLEEVTSPNERFTHVYVDMTALLPSK